MVTSVRLTTALALVAAAGVARAFHDGGVGACEGCHTMHGKETGERAGPTLLVGSDPSSTCLTCHGGTTPGGYQVLSTLVLQTLPPRNLTPGGDFGWLMRSYSWVGAGGALETSPGASHGHNVSAVDALLEPDYVRTTAPGGTYPSDRLSCISCHDPHGRYRHDATGGVSRNGSPISGSGSYGGAQFAKPTSSTSVGVYRLLGGVGYVPRSAGNVIPFSTTSPVALAPQSYNRSERTTETRVAYGAGMSEWCRNCHGQLHTSAATNTTSTFVHPAGGEARLVTGGELAIYNSYVRTGDLSGLQTSSYSSLVPYEEGTTDRGTLAPRAVSDGSALSGPSTGQENVMCLSCHRAHATAWNHALRWNMTPSGYVVVAGSWPGIDATAPANASEFAQGRTRAETQAAMNDRDASAYAAYQKVFCNKCHGEG